jgi:hypothetical protein
MRHAFRAAEERLRSSIKHRDVELQQRLHPRSIASRHFSHRALEHIRVVATVTAAAFYIIYNMLGRLPPLFNRCLLGSESSKQGHPAEHWKTSPAFGKR